MPGAAGWRIIQADPLEVGTTWQARCSTPSWPTLSSTSAAALVKVREERPPDIGGSQRNSCEVLISAMITIESASPFADMSAEQKRAIAQQLYQ
jgi:hypothetical protein